MFWEVSSVLFVCVDYDLCIAICLEDMTARSKRSAQLPEIVYFTIKYGMNRTVFV